MPQRSGDKVDLPAVLTLAELGRLLGMSKYRVQNQLRWANIKPRMVGNKFVVYLHQLRDQHPELYEAAEARARARTMSKILELMEQGVKLPNPE